MTTYKIDGINVSELSDEELKNKRLELELIWNVLSKRIGDQLFDITVEQHEREYKREQDFLQKYYERLK